MTQTCLTKKRNHFPIVISSSTRQRPAVTPFIFRLNTAAAAAVFFSCSRLRLSHGLPLVGHFSFFSLPIRQPHHRPSQTILQYHRGHRQQPKHGRHNSFPVAGSYLKQSRQNQKKKERDKAEIKQIWKRERPENRSWKEKEKLKSTAFCVSSFCR